MALHHLAELVRFLLIADTVGFGKNVRRVPGSIVNAQIEQVLRVVRQAVIVSCHPRLFKAIDFEIFVTAAADCPVCAQLEKHASPT